MQVRIVFSFIGITFLLVGQAVAQDYSAMTDLSALAKESARLKIAVTKIYDLGIKPALTAI